MNRPSDKFPNRAPRKSANHGVWIGLIVVVVLIAVAAFLYWRYFRPNSSPQPSPSATSLPATASSTATAASASTAGLPQHYPIPAPESATGTEPVLPTLAGSDAPFIGALRRALGNQPVDAYLVPSGLIRRIVVTVDDLGRNAPIPLRVRAVPATPGRMVVDGAGGNLTLSPANAARYRPLVEALQHVDMQSVAHLYFRYYPLFQQVYEELGFPNRYFNDRLIQVIDQMLLAPEVPEPIKLVQPHVLYQFADPDLQALTTGQKMMIRIGLQNEAIVKTKLRELRAAVVSGKPVRGK